MKIAIISDIHGNLPALQAVIDDIDHWGADQLIINGDLINRGPLSLDCLNYIQNLSIDHVFLKGNHEDFVLSCQQFNEPLDSMAYKIREFAHWTYAQVKNNINLIDAWDNATRIPLNSTDQLYITHGTLLGNRDSIRPATLDDELQLKVCEEAAYFITSHTHHPLIRQFKGVSILNTGSVGAPFDGDKRASYGRFWGGDSQWQMAIQRVAYDRESALSNYESSGFLDECGCLPQVMKRELELSRGLMGLWMKHYSSRVLLGELSIEDSVITHLNQYA